MEQLTELAVEKKNGIDRFFGKKIEYENKYQ